MSTGPSAHSAPASLTPAQAVVVALLRMAIGWHFLYEGVVKIVHKGWTSAEYLAQARGWWAGGFHWIAAHASVLHVVDAANIAALTLGGLALMFGLFTRAAAVGGAALLALYYLAALPLPASIPPGEGSYLVVNKNLVELAALVALAVLNAGRYYGMDRWRAIWRAGRAASAGAAEPPAPAAIAPVAAPAVSRARFDRREFIKGLAAVPVLGGFVAALVRRQGWISYEENILREAGEAPDGVTGATLQRFRFASLKELKGRIPTGRIKNLEISRLFLGGNLIGGWAHARDLIYVSKLVKAYHTDERVFTTFHIAEQCGINTILTNPQLSRVINAYWRREGGKIQFISDCGVNLDPIKGIEMSLRGNAHACYVQGEISDRLVPAGKFDLLQQSLDLMRRHGLPAGIGAHKLETVKACVEKGITPDFWVKTLHHVDYWSAKPNEQHDNIWCENPRETIAFMRDRPEPWIAFKILAAGAIHPEVGFPFAFRNGADFICVGMYDFQVVEDSNLALDALAGVTARDRPWRA